MLELLGIEQWLEDMAIECETDEETLLSFLWEGLDRDSLKGAFEEWSEYRDTEEVDETDETIDLGVTIIKTDEED